VGKQELQVEAAHEKASTVLTKPGTNHAGFLFIGASLKTASETIETMNLEMEISRLRLIIGDLRDELSVWREDPDNLPTKEQKLEWIADTDKLMYGETK